MMNQSNVPLDEISVRLSILCEYLLDNTKPIEEAYESLMEKLGTKLMEYTEFEYWFTRFQNKQFDLGYDTSLDSMGVPGANGKKDASTMTTEREETVKDVERQMGELKLDHQFDEKNEPQDVQTHGENAVFGIPDAIQFVNDNKSESSYDANKKNSDPGYDITSDSKEISKNQNTIDPEASEPVEIVKRKPGDLKSNYQFREENMSETFKTLINRQAEKVSKIGVYFDEQWCTIKLDDGSYKRMYDLSLCCASNDTVVRTNDREKSIVDHLYFVLRNPDIKLESFGIYGYEESWLKSPKLNTLLQSMFDTFNHQIQTSLLNCDRLNEDVFLSLLKHVDPETLETIVFDIPWKDEGNYQKLREIVETDQWKRAKTIDSRGVTPLKIDDLLQYECFSLQLDRITPEDVLRVTEHFFNSTGKKHCTLSSRNKSLDIDTIKDVLRSRNDGTEITEIYSYPDFFQFKIVKSTKRIDLNMNQSTVPYEEIENRLAICCEFLLDRKRLSEEAYESLMEQLGTKLMEYREFDYWFKRFQNNQFDLGYDTSLDSEEISEIQNTMDSEACGVEDNLAVIIETKDYVEAVERNMQDLKSDHQFNESDVPYIFQTLINRRSNLKEIEVFFDERCCIIKLDKIRIRLKKRRHDLTLHYASNETVIRTNDPEKSIIDHLWFVLRNPDIKLERFGIYGYEEPELELKNPHPQKLDFAKLNTLLQSMFNTFDHQIQTSWLNCDRLNEDTCFSMLKNVKPGTLKYIIFDISWKKEGNYRKMKEIVKTNQWKQAKQIFSSGVTPLKIDDFLQYEIFSLRLDRITPEDVLRVTEHVLNSAGSKYCTLSSRSESLDIDAIMDVLRSQIDGADITDTNPMSCIKSFRFKIVKSAKYAFLIGNEDYITIQNHSGF